MVIKKKVVPLHPQSRNKPRIRNAQMAESVDALVSNTSGFTSIPVRPRVWVRRKEGISNGCKHNWLVCPDGGIGRRAGLKHQWIHFHPGSTPGLGTETEKVEKLSPFFVVLGKVTLYFKERQYNHLIVKKSELPDNLKLFLFVFFE